MNRTETADLLDRRYAITGQPSNAKTIDAWCDVLAAVDYATACDAMRRCARAHPRIGLPELFAAMPRREHAPTHEPTYTGPIVPFDQGIRIAYEACVEQLITNGATPEDAQRRAAKLIGRLGDTIHLGEPF